MTTTSVESWTPSPAHFRSVLLGVAGVGFAVLFRAPALLVLAAPFAIVAGWSVTTRPVRDPSVDADLRPRAVREGEAANWLATFNDLSGADHVIAFAPGGSWLERRPRSGIVVADVGRFDHIGDVDEAIDEQADARLSLAFRATHWGRQGLGPINLAAVSDWGAFRWTALDVGQQLTVLPVPEVFDAAPPRTRANGLVGLNRSSRQADGSEFAGIRPFQTGDRLRRINWRTSLRTDSLHVTSTYADQDTHVALFVDALDDFGASGGIDGAASSLDTTVRATGAIAEHFLLRGDRVSLEIFGSRGRTTLPPSTGTGHLRRLLELLATVEPMSHTVGNLRLSQRPIPGDALAIMLSPLISPLALERAAAIASHGLTVAVVDTLPSDVHVTDDLTTELAWRIRLLERRAETRTIEHVGVPVVSWSGPGSLDPFLREIARRASAPRMARR